ncbi:Uncharacterised protein [Vibrio cholerae]|nr:Uncharacterised protein [Vibrio cholerae]
MEFFARNMYRLTTMDRGNHRGISQAAGNMATPA